MNFKQVRKTIKEMSILERDKLYKEAELTELEQWLVRYACIDERMAINTCLKLNISEGTYYRMLPIVMTKLYYTLKYTL